ncbi:uncharacterized protein LOC144102185 [Amblyomma americanum]
METGRVEQWEAIRNLHTIIFQTHILLKGDNVGGHTDCYTYPISAVGPKNLANNSHPILPVAEYAVNTSRAEEDKFRVMFSSTMGVMVYSSKKGRALTKLREPCENYYMANMELACADGLKKAFEETDMSQYAITADGQYLFAYDDMQSITAKVQRYLPSISDGWCLFDIHRDMYWACDKASVPLFRVQGVSKLLKDIKREVPKTAPVE